jgi:hypothetical protein
MLLEGYSGVFDKIKALIKFFQNTFTQECLTDNFQETSFGLKTITNTLITKPLIEKCQITFEQKFSSKKLRQRDFRKKSNENCQEAFH